MQITNPFSDRLALAMKMQKLSQADLAQKMAISQSTVSRWLRGSAPNDRTMFVIAKALGVKKEWLSAGLGEMHEEAPHAGPADVKREPIANTALQLSVAELLRPVHGNALSGWMDTMLEGMESARSKEEPIPAELLTLVKLVSREIVRRSKIRS